MAYSRTMDENFSKFLKNNENDDSILYAIDYTKYWGCFKGVKRLTLEVVENDPINGLVVRDANNKVERVYNAVNGDAKPGDKITGLGGMSPYYLYLSKGYYIDDINKPLSIISNMEQIPGEIIQEEYNVVPNISRLFVKLIDIENEGEGKIEKPNLSDKMLIDFNESQSVKSITNKENPNLGTVDPVKNSSNVYVVVLDKNYKAIRILKPCNTIPLKKDLRKEYLTSEVINAFLKEAREDYGGYTIAFAIANWSRKVFDDTLNSKITGDPYKKIYRIVDSNTFKPINPNLVLFKEKDCVPWMNLKEDKSIHYE